MKRLKIKWMPETSAMIPLSEVVPHGIAFNRLPTLDSGAAAAPCARLIVISGSKELKADVTSVQQCAA